MELTAEHKAHIDSLSYEQLLSRWRFAPIGDPWFAGATGDYWGQRMQELKKAGADHVGASKRMRDLERATKIAHETMEYLFRHFEIGEITNCPDLRTINAGLVDQLQHCVRNYVAARCDWESF